MSDKNEIFTEDLIKKILNFNIGKNDFGYVYPQGNVPDMKILEDCLKQAGGKPKECDLIDYSKGGNGKSKPEFIITFDDYNDLVVVIEAKKATKQHMSVNKSNPQGYAVDGVLYYAKFLKNKFNVIAIGVSGTNKDNFKIDTFFWYKDTEEPVYQSKLKDIALTVLNYAKAYKGEKISKNYSLEEIKETALLFHDKLRNVAFTEKEKPLFIASILIALEDNDFLKAYYNLPSFQSTMSLLEASVERVLKNNDVNKNNLSTIASSINVLGKNEKLKEIPMDKDFSLRWYIQELEMKIRPMMINADSSLDALGVFYHEFVRYSGGDGSGLGIVLTPQHLTEFMCDVANINYDSKVIDICCGSGSFLVTAMQKMFNTTKDPVQKEIIRQNNLYGVELNHELYLLAVANMIIRRDGKSNIIKGDCFIPKTIADLKNRNSNGFDIGLLNPPYAQKDDKTELEFVEQLLSLLKKGGQAVVVVPMSCALGQKFKDERERLFNKHTLKAVFSMPNDLFHTNNASVPVCVMVWEAFKPHDPNVKTFFGYYKDDGFVKRKKLGRIDANNKWQAIKEEWLYLYRNSEEKTGLSVKEAVKHNEEWCVEAYMETNYTVLTQADFEETVRKFVAFKIENSDKL